MNPISIGAAALALFTSTTSFALANDDTNAIRDLLLLTFDRLEARLTVAPISIVSGVAVAGWIQGDLGGRALLRQTNGAWQIVLCSGDALTDAATLQQLGLAPEAALELANAVAMSEEQLPPKIREQFASFQGLVMMDQHAAPPQAGSTHQPSNRK